MIFKLSEVLGNGASGIVFKATLQGPSEVPVPEIVAVKKARAPPRLKRTILQYEARVPQHLYGHPSIPAVYGYGRFPHFEYLAMEQLGLTLKQLHTPPRSLPIRTVLQVADQMLAALEYIHGRGFVHRDIKPNNDIVSLVDPTKLCLIDLDWPVGMPQADRLNESPEAERRHVVGTLDWCSLNAHYGVGLTPRDDLESLAYTLLVILNGNLPWLSVRRSTTDVIRTMKEIRISTHQHCGGTLAPPTYSEFGQLLDYARNLGLEERADYPRFRQLFNALHERSAFDRVEQFDWASVDPLLAPVIQRCLKEAMMFADSPVKRRQIERVDDKADREDDFTDSYYSWDMADWDDYQGERALSLTLPAEDTEYLDSQLPTITEIV